MKSSKLVRDLIPSIATGRTFIKADKHSFPQYVRDKLQEELKEVLEAKTGPEKAEELADLLEVMQAFARVEGIKWNDVVHAKAKKAREKGTFEDGIVMVFE